MCSSIAAAKHDGFGDWKKREELVQLSLADIEPCLAPPNDTQCAMAKAAAACFNKALPNRRLHQQQPKHAEIYLETKRFAQCDKNSKKRAKGKWHWMLKTKKIFYVSNTKSYRNDTYMLLHCFFIFGP